MRTILAVAVLSLAAGAAGCGATTPVWYESEPGKTEWSLPLMNPLADAEPLVPVFLEGKGPYLFVLDPESPLTMVDRGVAEQVGLYYHSGYIRLLNQRDVTTPHRVYEALSLRTGDLHARKLEVAGAPAGSLRAGGRTIHGVIGSDLLSRTIVVDLDRDAGVVRLALTGHARVPDDAAKVEAALHRGTLRVNATVNGALKADLIVHIAREMTSLRYELLQQARVALVPDERVIVDETGDAVTVNGRGAIETLRIGSVAIEDVGVIPYQDERERRDITYQGVLGQNALSRYRTIIDRDHKVVWLAPRAGDLGAGTEQRLARWGDAFARCEATACTELAFDSATRTLTVRPTVGAPGAYRVTIQALDEGGAAIEAPLLEAEVAPEQGSVMLREPGTHPDLAAAAAFRIVDAAPR